jgi:hypothetical protein
MSDNTISQLNALSIQYNNTLNLYKQTYQNYIDSLKLLNGNNRNLVQVPKTIYLGNSNLNSQIIGNVNECQKICSLNKICSGATYNLQNNNCSTKKGKSDLIKGSEFDISIVPKYLKLSYELKNINNNLINLNEKMMILMNSSASNYQQDALKRQKQQEVLKNNYNNLYVERDEINKMIYQYETIDSRLNDSELKLTEYYSRYIVLLLITIIIFILFFNYFIPNIFSNNLNGGSNKINSFINKLIR